MNWILSKMRTHYGETISIGDWVCWSPYRGHVKVGKVVAITKTENLKVDEWSTTQQKLWSELIVNSLPSLVRTKAVIKIKPLN